MEWRIRRERPVTSPEVITRRERQLRVFSHPDILGEISHAWLNNGGLATAWSKILADYLTLRLEFLSGSNIYLSLICTVPPARVMVRDP